MLSDQGYSRFRVELGLGLGLWLSHGYFRVTFRESEDYTNGQIKINNGTGHLHDQSPPPMYILRGLH